MAGEDGSSGLSLVQFWRHTLVPAQRQSLVKWLIFTVIVGLLPIIISWGLARMQISKTPSHPVGDGDLLIVTTIVAVTALGDLLTSSSSREIAPMVTGAIATLLALFSAVLYGIVSNFHRPGGHVVLGSSLILFVMTVVCGAICVLLAEEVAP